MLAQKVVRKEHDTKDNKKLSTVIEIDEPDEIENIKKPLEEQMDDSTKHKTPSVEESEQSN